MSIYHDHDHLVVRQYNEEFCKTGQVIVPFQSVEEARAGLFHSAGRSIGTKPVIASLVIHLNFIKLKFRYHKEH